jgi:hypothetical protein
MLMSSVILYMSRAVCFSFLGVVGVVQPRTPVRADVVGVRRVAGAALHAQGTLPLFHQLVHLLSGHVLGQYLQVGRRGMGMWRAGVVRCRRAAGEK